jgi:hypothetical protein
MQAIRAIARYKTWISQMIAAYYEVDIVAFVNLAYIFSCKL